MKKLLNKLRSITQDLLGVKTFDWTMINLVYPAIPLLMGAFYLNLRGTITSYSDLLGGTELYLLIFGVLLSTTAEFHSLGINFKQASRYNLISKGLLATSALSSVALGMIYVVEVENRAQNIIYSKQLVADFALMLLATVLVICIPTQAFVILKRPLP